MVKLKGPGLAARAAGQLAGELVFSNWKGTAYLKRHRDPKQPRSDPQIAMRATMTWLASCWDAFTDYAKATWTDLAAQTDISPFNAYQGYNLERWRRYKFPSVVYPATETGNPTYFDNFTVTGGIRCATISLRVTLPRDGWGLHLHRRAGAPVTPAWHNLVYVFNALSTGTFTWTDTPLAAGSYWYTVTRTTIYGSDPPAHPGPQEAVVTD